MVHTFLSRLGRLGLALVVTSSLLAACLGLVSFAAQPPNVARETAAPDLRGFGNPSLRSGQALEGLQAAPAVDFVAATLSPVKVTQGVSVTFTVNVVNTGELSVTLDTTTALAFSDGAGGEFSATLAAATNVPTSTAPSYVQVPLAFSPAAFPAGFAAGSYPPILRLSGTDGDGQPYSATVTSSGNSVQVVDYVTPTLPIAVAAGSLDPADVIQGEPVSFRLGLVNPNAMDITLGSGTTLAFTDSNSLVYAAALLDAPILPTGVTTTVELRLTRVATETVPGVYTPTVALVGTDLGGFPVYQSTDLPDAVIVWEPTPGLVEAQGSLQPTLPDRYTGLLARIDVTNTLPCTVSLDARSRVMLTLDSQAMLSRNLNGTQVLPPGKRRPVYFASASLDNLPDAIYELYVTLFGINVCDGSVLRSAFKVSNTMQLIPVPPVGSFVGISPASLTLWLTQYGGAIPMEVAGGHQTLPEVQRLYSFELGNTCRLAEGCGSVIFMPDNTFQRLEPYTYLRTAEVYQNYIYIKPSEAMTRGVQYILGARNCTESASSGGGIGGAYCAGAGLAFYFVDRDAKERVVNFSGNDTFWVRGQPGSLHLDSINPETGGASSTLTVQDDLTLLRMHRAETDVSDAFASNISTPAVSITPQTTATLEFVVTPTLAAPLGPIELDAQVTTRGEYPYLIGPFVNCDLMRCAGLPYDGPSRIVMTGTVTATDFISPAHIYVVDALPLSLAADSLTPAAVAWDATSLTLTARVSNTSDLSFTIFPTSELEIPFRPIDNDLLMEIGAGLPVDSGSWGRGVAQSFVVTQPVRLGAATFETQLPPLTQALSVRVASSLSGGPDTARTLRQVTIDHPSYTLYETQAFTSPDLNVELQPNWTYWLIVELVGGESEMWAPSFGGDFYPAGELQQFRNGSWMADWGRDLKLRLARMEVYRGLLVTPLALSPGQAVTGTFVNTNTLPARADGIYTPTLLLRGLFTDTVGTYDFHQHLDGSGNPVMVDTTPPIAQVAPIGGFSDFPSFVVGWTGSDNISGIAGYDVQVREPGGAWTGWLTGTTALSATFASPDPRLPYEFRVRTADRTGNVSDWSTEVTGPNDATPPEVAMTALMVYNNAAFTVGWQGSDAVAGLARFDVQMQAGGNGWTDWLTTTSALTATFTGVDLTTYAFRTRATDRAGNVSEWTPLVTTTVDTSAPSALVDPLAEWQPETFAVSWAGSDILSGVTTFDVQTRVGDGDWSDWLPGAAVTASLFTGSDGQTYAFRVRAADAAGNVGAWSQEVTVIIDAIGPTAVVNGDGWWRPLIFDVSWSGSDDRSGVAYYNVQYFRYENNCYCWASWLAHTTATSATFTVTAGGFAGFIAQAVDGAGNVGAWSAQKWFQVDATPPTAAMTGLPSVQYTPTFTLAWSGSDGSGGSGIAVFDIEVKESAGDWTGWLTRVTSTTATFSGQDGQAYRFRARAIDSASNVGAWSQEVTTTVHVDSTPPTSTLSALPLYSIPYFTASWSGTDDLSGVASYQVQYRQCLCWSYDTCTLDQQSIWEQTCGDWADWLVWTPATSALFNENWQILRLRVRAKDLVDNIGEWSPEQIVFLDPIPPWGYIYELPFWSRRPLTVSWYLTDLVSGVATFAVQYRVAGGDWGTWVEGTTERSAAFSGEDGHTYEFRVRPTDLVGNVGEWSPARSTTVDATPPTAALNALPAFQATGIFTVAWSGTDATAGVANYDVEFSEDSGTWNDWQRSVAVTSTIFAGTDGHSYAFRARATDNAGNVSDWTTPVTTTVVTSAPPAAIITPTRGGASGSDLILAWSRPAGMAAFQVWRSATPYFTPGVGGSTLIGDETSANCTVGETTVTCTDAGALGSVGSYFYVVRTFNGAGLWSDSAGSAAFTFGITPGGP
ncbi:MAG: hypothetical protein NT169_16775 [Chloroflexi bacterium]|nr:hypothetical protein [Chloroflexota bacterium]